MVPRRVAGERVSLVVIDGPAEGHRHMRTWLRRTRGAVFLGLTWAVVWVPVALLMSMIVDPDGSMDQPWILVGAYPGFLSAVVFSMVIWVAERRRRFDELSLTRVGALGAVAGLLVGLVPFVAGSNSTSLPTWLLMFATIGSITLLSAVGRRFAGAREKGGEGQGGG